MGCTQSTQRHPERATAPKEETRAPMALSPRNDPAVASPVESAATSPVRQQQQFVSPPRALVGTSPSEETMPFGHSASCGASPASPLLVLLNSAPDCTPVADQVSPADVHVDLAKEETNEKEEVPVLTPRPLAVLAPPSQNKRSRRNRSRTPRGRQPQEEEGKAAVCEKNEPETKENSAPARGRSPSKRGKSPSGRQPQQQQQAGNQSPSRRGAKSPGRNRSPMRSGSARRGLAPAADANGAPTHSRKVQFNAAALVEPRPEEKAAAQKERVKKATGRHHGNLREDVFLATLSAFERQLTRKSDLDDHLATR